MTQSQSEQGQRLLQKMQSEMAAETVMRQQLLSNQLQMLTQIQLDAPNTNFDINEVFTKSKKVGKENLSELMKEKIEEVEIIFRMKEDKLKEYYEQVVKELEGKLDNEQGRYIDLLTKCDEEKNIIITSHKKEIIRMTKDTEEIQETIKQEYNIIFQNMKDLHRLEMDSVHEITASTSKMSEITSNVDINSKVMAEIQTKVQGQLSDQSARKELALQQKEKELLELQERLIKKQELSEGEPNKLTESIIKLEGHLSKKYAVIEREVLELESARRNLDLEKKAFESEKSLLLTKVEDEKKKNTAEIDIARSEVEEKKNEYCEKEKMLQTERARYNINQRFNCDTIGENNIISVTEMDAMMMALGEEKKKMKSDRAHLKEFKEKLIKSKKKVATERKQLASAIEQLYEVEVDLNHKIKESEELHRKVLNMKQKGCGHVDFNKDIEDTIKHGIREIQESIVELLRLEQKTKSDKFSLETEKRKMLKSRDSANCSNCLNKARRFTSVQNLNGYLEEDRVERAGEGHTLAWMEDFTGRLGIHPRSSGDGASHDLLDSNVTSLRREAESDSRFLKNEMEYLKTIQRINMSTLSKYQ